MNALLQINDLTKIFPGQASPALEGINFSVEKAGEIINVSGPNGSGKTTLLKCIAGLVAPTHGTIEIFGETLSPNSHNFKKHIGMSTDQERSFYWRLSGKENIRFFTGLFGISAGKIDKKLQVLSEVFSVGSWLDKPFSQYSTGIRQRFSIIRALAHEPKLLLLDEPCRSLDGTSRNSLWHLLSRLSSEKGVTIIYTTPETYSPEIENTKSLFIEKGKIKS
jgi:ABC-2 type transport system ATP-binding protein